MCDFYKENTIFEKTRDIQKTSKVLHDFLIRQGLNANDEQIQLFKDTYVSHFAKAKNKPHMVDLIKNDLQPIVSTGILSNISILDCVRQGEQMDNYSMFDYKYLSCDIGLMKPEPSIYALVEQTFEPQNIYFVDDSEINIMVAKARGWNTLHSYEDDEIMEFFRKNLIEETE
jgi:HAD superfamily hydrolase (TIGR01509 family)